MAGRGAVKGAPQRRYTAREKSELKAEALELRAQALSWNTVCGRIGVPEPTFKRWRQHDESFTLACAAADGQRRDFLVDKCLEMAMSEDTPAPQRAWMLMFLTKQADPSFRDNAKIEHTISGGLQSALREFAKAGRVND